MSFPRSITHESPVLVDDEKQLFEFRKDSLPGELVPASMEVMKFSGLYLKIDGGKSYMDWPGLSQAAKDYKGDDLAFDRYEHTSMNLGNSTVGTMVDRIVAYLRDTFNASYEEKEIKAVVEATFLNLETKKWMGGFLSFSTDEVANNLSYQYRVLFAVPIGNSPSHFYALVTTIKVTADALEWGKSSSRNVGVEIDGMELVVQKGYKLQN